MGRKRRGSNSDLGAHQYESLALTCVEHPSRSVLIPGTRRNDVRQFLSLRHIAHTQGPHAIRECVRDGRQTTSPHGKRGIGVIGSLGGEWDGRHARSIKIRGGERDVMVLLHPGRKTVAVRRMI